MPARAQLESPSPQSPHPQFTIPEAAAVHAPPSAIAAAAGNPSVQDPTGPSSNRSVLSSLLSAFAKKHSAESSGSIAVTGVASPSPAVHAPAPSSNPPPAPVAESPAPTPAPVAESPAPTPAPAPNEYWSPDDEVAILNALRPRRGHEQDALLRGVDLAMAVFGRLRRTDYSLADLEAKIDALRRRFEENDTALCTGTGGPAPGHDLRLYTLSLEVWGAAVTPIAAPKPAEPAPASVVNPTGKKVRDRTAPRRWEPAPVPKRRRYEELRERCPKLVALVEELMRKGIEGVSDVGAWSMEMRLKNQQLAGGVASACTEDLIKEHTNLITRLI